jgi:citrate lyase subunit beta/citryl-CoA lyase
LLAELGPLGLPVVAIVETARGLHDAYEIALAPGVEALALGANDLGADLGLDRPLDGDVLAYARARLVFESAAAGLRAPFDRVSPFGLDVAALRVDATTARDVGFGGKSCVRPEHAALIDAVFAVGAVHHPAVPAR